MHVLLVRMGSETIGWEDASVEDVANCRNCRARVE
jgi:hypothetical protein